MRARATLAFPLLTAVFAIACQIRAAKRPAPATLTSYVPQDALLTIE